MVFPRNSVIAGILICWVICVESKAFNVARPKDFRHPIDTVEPTCEELKAMWRFSKRQSRAAEVTNEIPTYRDPFSYNVWEPLYSARSRSIGGLRIGTRYRPKPVYGRVVHKAPMLRVQDIAERNRAFEEVARLYGTVPRGTEPRRRMTSFRLSGGHSPSVHIAPQAGSFQHLKELIRTERARELQEQRMAEEVAARAAALKQLAGGFQNQASLRDQKYNNYDSDDGDGRNLMMYPDYVGGGRTYEEDPEDFYPRPFKRTHSSSFYDYFDNDLDGIMV